MNDPSELINSVLDIPEGAPPVTSSVDNKATKEQQAILGNQYEDDGKKRAHVRLQQFKDVAHYALICLIIFGVFLIGVFTAIWAWHMVAPPSLRWLDADGVEHIQVILFSGALSATITLLGKKAL